VKVGALKTQHIDDFIRKRLQEPGRKKQPTVSPATANKELRHLRAVLAVAKEWHYLAERKATMPEGLQGATPADWWRGLFVFAYMTGWRVGDLLALRRDAVDMEAGYALTRYEDNKGGRDDRVKLRPVVLDHLKRLPGFGPLGLPWPHDRRTLDVQLDRIQEAAGAHLLCHRDHEHTPACHLYGFHDFRRAFATQNAPRLTPDALQKLMRHKSYLTTQVYINLASQIDEAVNVLHVPDVLHKPDGKGKGGEGKASG
jgi:integrase